MSLDSGEIAEPKPNLVAENTSADQALPDSSLHDIDGGLLCDVSTSRHGLKNGETEAARTELESEASRADLTLPDSSVEDTDAEYVSDVATAPDSPKVGETDNLKTELQDEVTVADLIPPDFLPDEADAGLLSDVATVADGLEHGEVEVPKTEIMADGSGADLTPARSSVDQSNAILLSHEATAIASDTFEIGETQQPEAEEEAGVTNANLIRSNSLGDVTDAGPMSDVATVADGLEHEEVEELEAALVAEVSGGDLTPAHSSADEGDTDLLSYEVTATSIPKDTSENGQNQQSTVEDEANITNANLIRSNSSLVETDAGLMSDLATVTDGSERGEVEEPKSEFVAEVSGADLTPAHSSVNESDAELLSHEATATDTDTFENGETQEPQAENEAEDANADSIPSDYSLDVTDAGLLSDGATVTDGFETGEVEEPKIEHVAEISSKDIPPARASVDESDAELFSHGATATAVDTFDIGESQEPKAEYEGDITNADVIPSDSSLDATDAGLLSDVATVTDSFEHGEVDKRKTDPVAECTSANVSSPGSSADEADAGLLSDAAATHGSPENGVIKGSDSEFVAEVTSADLNRPESSVDETDTGLFSDVATVHDSPENGAIEEPKTKSVAEVTSADPTQSVPSVNDIDSGLYWDVVTKRYRLRTGDNEKPKVKYEAAVTNIDRTPPDSAADESDAVAGIPSSAALMTEPLKDGDTEETKESVADFTEPVLSLPETYAVVNSPDPWPKSNASELTEEGTKGEEHTSSTEGATDTGAVRVGEKGLLPLEEGIHDGVVNEEDTPKEALRIDELILNSTTEASSLGDGETEEPKSELVADLASAGLTPPHSPADGSDGKYLSHEATEKHSFEHGETEGPETENESEVANADRTPPESALDESDASAGMPSNASVVTEPLENGNSEETMESVAELTEPALPVPEADAVNSSDHWPESNVSELRKEECEGEEPASFTEVATDTSVANGKEESHLPLENGIHDGVVKVQDTREEALRNDERWVLQRTAEALSRRNGENEEFNTELATEVTIEDLILPNSSVYKSDGGVLSNVATVTNSHENRGTEEQSEYEGEDTSADLPDPSVDETNVERLPDVATVNHRFENRVLEEPKPELLSKATSVIPASADSSVDESGAGAGLFSNLAAEIQPFDNEEIQDTKKGSVAEVANAELTRPDLLIHEADAVNLSDQLPESDASQVREEVTKGSDHTTFTEVALNIAVGNGREDGSVSLEEGTHDGFVKLQDSQEEVLTNNRPEAKLVYPNTVRSQAREGERSLDKATITSRLGGENEYPLSSYIQLPQEVGKHVIVLQCESSAPDGVCHVYVIGTAHVSKASCEEVQNLICHVKPQVVFLELCSSRTSTLLPQKHEVPTLSSMFETWKKKEMNFFGILYSWFLAKVGEKLEVLPGTEFRIGYEEGVKYGAEVTLGDRPIQITLQRAWGGMSTWTKTRFLFSILLGTLNMPTADEIASMMAKMEQNDEMTIMIQELSKLYPTLSKTLISERDLYMVASLRSVARRFSSVVAVVGRGHLAGIANYWKEDINVEELLSVPSKKPSYRLWRWSAVALGVGGIVVAGVHFVRRR